LVVSVERIEETEDEDEDNSENGGPDDGAITGDTQS